MSRSDLLIQLVHSAGNDDKHLFKKVVEAIIAEERSKQHNTLAEKLQETLSQINFSLPAKNYFVNGVNKQTDGRNFLYEITPNVKAEDLILNDNIREMVDNIVEEQMRADLLRSYNIEPRNRVMLIGPPGNGKTSLAEVIASSLMLPLLSVKYESIIGSYLGETSSRLKSLFDYIRTQNCVLFFDEFDSIGKERGDIHETGEIKRVVSSLLLQIDKLPSYVIVVVATNHPELLDKAVWRRFQLKAILQKPTIKEINIFLNTYQKKYNIDFGKSQTIAQNLKGLSFSEIKEFCDDILRKYILSLPNSPKTLATITARALSRIKMTYKLQN